MAKLNTVEKMDRKMFKGMAVKQNGRVFSDRVDGLTIVVVPACGREDSEFVQVAVAQCSPADKFSRKRGELVALERWANGNVLSIPRRGRCLDNVAEDVAIVLM